MKEITSTIIQEPASIDFQTLELLLQKYPWFSVLHVLWLLKTRNERPENFGEELKKHIVFVRNRKQLHEILAKGSWKNLVEEAQKCLLNKGSASGEIDEAFEKELLDFSYDNASGETLDEDKAGISVTISSETDTIDENPGEPDNFSGSGESEFAGWIDKFGNENNSPLELIDRFLEADPGPIRADKETFLKGDVSKTSIEENDHFITDTLAKIYIKQGLYSKAIFAYEKLSLKYPEKSAYFAAQIEEIKSLTQNN